MKTERRWLKSVLAASTQPLPALPWARGARRKPEVATGIAPAAQRPAAASHTALAAR